MNKNINELLRLRLSTKDSLKYFHQGTRDDPELEILKCKKSGVIVLEKCKHNEDYYKNNKIYKNKDISMGSLKKNDPINKAQLQDDLNRFNSYKKIIKDKNYLDFGCCKGELLKKSKGIAKYVAGVELEHDNRKELNKTGIDCFEYVTEIKDKKFDLVTLNHVFEHLSDPLKTIDDISNVMKKGALLIIEVPHARDILIEIFDSMEFKKFTFWSEHLILHTKQSLEKFLTYSKKFNCLEVQGLQRYPITNHYYWLLKGKPGGHEHLKNIDDKEFHSQYEKYLDNFELTDSIVGFFKKK
tara:strand:+ start:2104 stop:2997 length:894 start_codon:yes stop_codon:yes gene_type:complete